MSDKPLFQNTDEQEVAYAPDQLPADQRDRVRADEGTDAGLRDANEPPVAAPVANVGTSASGQAAPPGVMEEQRDVLRADVDPFGSDPNDEETRRSP